MWPERPMTSCTPCRTDASSFTSSVTGWISSFSFAIAAISSVAVVMVRVPEPREVERGGETDTAAAARDEDNGHGYLPIGLDGGQAAAEAGAARWRRIASSG